MAQHWKEVIRPGITWYPGKDGKYHRLVATREAVDHLHKQTKDMLAAGLSIPVPLEHQDVRPMTAAQIAAKTLENNAGWVRDAKIEGGALFHLVDITDPKIEEKIKNGSITSTSPRIDPEFVDGNNRTWNNCITHFALTLRPRLAVQKAFGKPIPTGFDKAPLLSLTSIKEAVMPRAGLAFNFQSEKGWFIRDPIQFAMDDEIAKEDLDIGGETGADTGEGSPAETPPEEDAMGGSGKDADCKACLEMLEMRGIHLPPETDAKNFIQHLKVALHAVTGPDKAAEEEASRMAAEGNAPNQEAPVVQEQQPMYMSIDAIAKKGDPVVTGMARTMITGAIGKRQQRIAAVAARNNNKDLQTRLLKMSEAVQCSIKADGTGVYDPMESTLETLELAVPDVRGQLVGRATGTILSSVEMAHPAAIGTGLSPDQAKSIADDLAAAAGYPAAK